MPTYDEVAVENIDDDSKVAKFNATDENIKNEEK